MSTFTLTDDEVVAIAVDRSGAWAGALPTVDTDQAESLAAAAFRGQRSLVVRNLIDDAGELDTALAELTGPAVSSQDLVSVYLGDAEFQRASWGLATTHYRSTGWMLETVTVLGVHRLSREPVESHRTYFHALLSAAVTDGPPSPEGEAQFLCLASVSPDARHVVFARRGELGVTRQDAVTGALRDPEPLDAADLDAVVDSLLIAGSATV